MRIPKAFSSSRIPVGLVYVYLGPNPSDHSSRRQRLVRPRRPDLPGQPRSRSCQRPADPAGTARPGCRDDPARRGCAPARTARFAPRSGSTRESPIPRCRECIAARSRSAARVGDGLEHHACSVIPGRAARSRRLALLDPDRAGPPDCPQLPAFLPLSPFVTAVVWITPASALTPSKNTGLLDPNSADAIGGRLRRSWPARAASHHFVVDPYQAGAATFAPHEL